MFRRFLPVLVVGGSFAGGVFSDGLFGARRPLAARDDSPLPPPPAFVPADRPVEPPDRFGAVIARVAPAVVSVDAIKEPTPPAAAPVARPNKGAEESGSGAMVRFEGFRGTYVVTNNHVIAGARPGGITVTLADGRIFQPDLIRTDPESDVALLRLASEDLPTVVLADSDKVRVGQWVLAFGSPFGLNQTVTHGIISARDRGQISLGNTIRIKEFLQTDAAINPGSSGGPLADMTGTVIGVNTAIASSKGENSGVSFSIPANLVRRVAKQLLDRGTVSRGYLGLQLTSSLEPAAALRLGLNRVWGALVDGVHPDGPAATAGVRAGDVILQVDGVDVRDENQLINLVSSLPAGQKVRLTLWRARARQVAEPVVAAWTGTATMAGRTP